MEQDKMWVITILSITGIILNIHKRKECFIIWAVTNFSWMIYDFHIKAYEQSFLFLIYFLLAIWGLIKWGKVKDE